MNTVAGADPRFWGGGNSGRPHFGGVAQQSCEQSEFKKYGFWGPP